MQSRPCWWRSRSPCISTRALNHPAVWKQISGNSRSSQGHLDITQVKPPKKPTCPTCLHWGHPKSLQTFGMYLCSFQHKSCFFLVEALAGSLQERTLRHVQDYFDDHHYLWQEKNSPVQAIESVSMQAGNMMISPSFRNCQASFKISFCELGLLEADYVCIKLTQQAAKVAKSSPQNCSQAIDVPGQYPDFLLRSCILRSTERHADFSAS